MEGRCTSVTTDDVLRVPAQEVKRGGPETLYHQYNLWSVYPRYGRTRQRTHVVVDRILSAVGLPPLDPTPCLHRTHPPFEDLPPTLPIMTHS